MKNADTPAAASPGEVAVTLQAPIVRGATEISVLRLRRPKAGALRGIKLFELLQMDGGALMALLPRITEPPLVAHEVNNLDPADLVAIGSEVIGFLVPEQTLEQARATAAETASLSPSE